MTKKKSTQTQDAAQQIVKLFGIKKLDSLPVSIRNVYLSAMRNHLQTETGIAYQTALSHIKKACRRLRGEEAPPDEWGGERQGSGRKPISGN